MKSPLRSMFALALLLVAFLVPSSAHAENVVKVCVELPSGTLQIKSATIGASQCPTLATPHEVVAVFVFWEEGSSQFAEEWSGHELFSCYDSNGDTVVQQLDVTGGDKGAKRKTYAPSASPPTGLVDLPDNVADTAAAGQVQWVVKDGGTGSSYSTALSSCRTLASYPPS